MQANGGTSTEVSSTEIGTGNEQRLSDMTSISPATAQTNTGTSIVQAQPTQPQQQQQQQQQQHPPHLRQPVLTESTTGGSSMVAKTKSAMKKLARRQRYLEKRLEKRKIEKEKIKLKKIQRRESGQVIEPKKRYKLMADSSNKFRVVIDMDFEEYMTDQELSKSAQQVNRIYCLNRHSDEPFQLYISSFKGKIQEKFAVTNKGYQNWDVNFSELDYVDIFKDKDSEADKEQVEENPDSDDKKRKDDNRENNDNIIYLTGDAEESLPDMDELLKDESKIFVIGGLVDHNRHKNLCYTRAQGRNIRTAKLPIKEHVQLTQRHILSTVTVFEILLNVLGIRRPWLESLESCIPKRKLAPKSSDQNIGKDEQMNCGGS